MKADKLGENEQYHWLSRSVPLVAALLLLLVGGGFFAQKEHFRQQERKLQLAEKAVAHSRLLERQIEQAVAATSLLGAVLQTTHSAESIDLVVDRLLQSQTALSTLQIAPDGVAWRTYKSGRLSSLPQEPFLQGFIPSTQLIPFGTPSLFADTNGLIATQIIHTVNAKNSRFWGYTSAVITIDELLKGSQLTELNSLGYDYQLLFQARNSSKPIRLSQSANEQNNRAIKEITTSNGETLTLFIQEKENSTQQAFMYAELILVGFAAMLLGLFLHIFLRRPGQLQKEVHQRTAQLAKTNKALAESNRLLDSIFDHLPLLLILKRADNLQIVRVNEFTERFFCKDKAALLGRKYEDLLPIEQANNLIEGDLQTLSDERAIDMSDQLISAGDSLRTLSMKKIPLFDSHGIPEFILDVAIDLSEKQGTENKLRLAARVFENSAEGIMITDASNRILMVNKSFTHVTGYSPEEALGQSPSMLSSGKQDARFYQEMWQTIQQRNEWHGEVQNRRKNGEFYSEWLTISSVRNEQNTITNYVAVFTDITSSKKIEERLNFLANFDTLTSLPNRLLFNDRLEQALAQAKNDTSHVAVLFLDLDRFNLINETFGHSAGDKVLQEVAIRVKNALRPGDSASRLGGDEFAVILPALDSTEEAGLIAHKIMQTLARPFLLDQHELYTSASIGISLFPEDGDNAQSLIKNADSAMYRAMEEGRNTFRYYHQEMNARSSERLSLEKDLRHALERGELVMHYQPFIDSQSGKIIGAEALLRWWRPGVGYVSPSVFIPLLEETGLIITIGEWILKTACVDNQIWRQQGFANLFVAVNLSAMQLDDEHLARKLADLLLSLDFEAKYLEIELTESMIMRNAERGTRMLHAIKKVGVKLSIDDFGTGYSSLSYLKKLPLDTLKIDRSFVEDTPEENEANAIVQAIVSMGHSLHLNIVAEGVQEQEQVDFLRNIRCDVLQGFHFSAALPQTEFLALLHAPTI